MEIALTGISRISDDSGRYLLLVDYGSEGLSVFGQFKTAEDAIKVLLQGGYGGAAAIVKIVSVVPEEDQ